MYISEALTYNCSSIRTAASLLYQHARSIGLSPLTFVMLIDAPCLINIAMASVELVHAAKCTGVSPSQSSLFTSAPFCRSNRMMSVQLYSAARKSAVWPHQLTQSTGTPSCNILSTRLTSTLWPAASRKRRTRSSLISMEETVKLKQFDVCQTLWSITYFRSNVGASKKKLFRVEINLSAINNSIFLKNGDTDT